MKKSTLLVVMISFLGLFLVSESSARFRKRRGSGGWGANSQYGRKYTAKTVETIEGEVINVDKITPKGCRNYGIHLMVKTDKETISVHLGPGWFIENQDTQIEKQDKIKVKGSRVDFEGKQIIIAKEVTKGDETLVLRDEKGFPAWSGWRRHQ